MASKIKSVLYSSFFEFAMRAKCILLLLLFVLLPCQGNTGAEEPGEQEPSLDALEFKLEIGRHENLISQKKYPQSVLAEFATDGCSGGLSVGWQYLSSRIEYLIKTDRAEPPWESCCIEHDRVYHTGGLRGATALQSFMARKEADLALKACVLQTGKARSADLSAEFNLSPRETALLYSAISDLMYRAVRVGGLPCTGLPWRWGYGWPKCNIRETD